MAVDKNKIIAEATKLVQKGAYDKAIKQYERILAEDAKDVRVLLKVGELYQKKGDDRMAADAFKRVAETYADQGFFLKSVAVYKQVVKLDAEDVRVNERLSGLYQQLGLLSEAMAQLQVIAGAHEKAGDGARLLDTLKRMVELDPDNIGSVVRLGKLYQGANQPGPALEHYRRAASYLKAHNRADDYLKVAERIVELAPNDLSLARELANIYMAKGDTKRALAKLQVCFKADGRDVDTLTLLAQAFRDLGQTSKTVQVFKTLADVHERAGRRADALAAWRKVAELAPGDPDATRLLGDGPPGPLVTPPPDPRPGSPPLAPVSGTPVARMAVAPPLQAFSAPPPAPPPRSPPPPAPVPRPASPPAAAGPEGISKLLTETEVYLKYGLADKALAHLRSILAIDPETPVALEKLRDLHLAAGRRGEALEAAEQAVRAALAKGDLDRAKDSLARLRALDPGHTQLADLAEAAGTTEEIELHGGEVEEQLEAGELPSTPAELELADEPAPRPFDDDALAELAAGSAAGDDVVEDEPVEPIPAPVSAAGARSASVIAPPPPPAGPAPIRVPPPTLEIELEGPDERLLRMAQESLDTDEVVGDGPEALPPEPDRTLANDLDALPAEVERATVMSAPQAPADLPVPPRGGRTPAQADLADELEEADFYAQQGLLSEAREALHHLLDDHPGHPVLEARLADVERRLAAKAAPAAPARPNGAGQALTPPPSDPRAVRQSPSLVDPSAAAGSSFDIGAELAEELDRVPDLVGLDDEFQYSVEDVFNQFKRGVAETVTAEDSDTHYDLGIAYKEMGLVDDAVNEFETALRGSNRKKEVESLSMIALCRMSQGRPGDALEPLRRALRSDYLNKENAKAIHFELGLAYEELGEQDEALWCFHKVSRLEPGYRDVAARISALGSGPGRPPPGMAPATPRPLAGPPRPAGFPSGPPRPGPAAMPAAATSTQPPAASPPGAKKNIGFL